MKILTDRQIREADRVTVEREGISSLELMERAAEEIARWLAKNVEAGRRLLFCCGKGGNGGDGLAAARILAAAGHECVVFMAAAPEELVEDARINLARLPEEIEVYDITAGQPDIEEDAVIVDALLGVGVSGEAREPLRGVIEWINAMPNCVISIDMPSGMATEWGSGRNDSSSTETRTSIVSRHGKDNAAGGFRSDVAVSSIVCAKTTLTIGFPKLSLLQPETGEYAGEIVVLDIGLDEEFIAEANTPYYYITEEWVESLRRPRAKFSHKGDYGHALVVCGSAAMPGAAVLAVGGALRSGCGLVTVHIPEAERFAIIANHPAAMLSLDAAECFSTLPDGLDRFSAIGVGPGLGRDPRTVETLEKLLSEVSRLGIRMVLDADALNIIAERAYLKQFIPAGSVLTPHLGELRRLVGEWADDREKLEKASRLAAETASVIIVKGAHSAVCTPDGCLVFNSTGTSGMAKGGSGDVLAGLLTGLLARGYDAEIAAITGVYAHGRAGERAAEMYGTEAMNSADLAEMINLNE